MNKTKEKKTVKTSKHGFYTVLGIIVFALIAAGVLSVCEKKLNWIDYENQVFSSIGIVCQIVSGIVCCVQSILGLSISLQHQDFLDIPLSKYYALRTRPFFDFRLSSIISFLLLLVSAISFLFSIVIMCVSAAIISVGFCFYLLCVEIPFLMLKEKPILEIVKDRIIMEYNGKIDANNYLTREFVEILESLICNKDLRWVYNQLSINDQTDYNKKLLYRLLDVQSNMAFHLDKIESKNALVKVTDGMLTTVCDMTSSDFDIVEILGPQTHDYMYFLTRVFFCLLKNPQSKEKAEERIAQLATSFFASRASEAHQDLAFSVLTILIIDSIKANDFSLPNKVKKEWTQLPYSLQNEGVSTRIFAMISCLMYYLAEIEDTFPLETKEGIRSFINTSGIQDNWEVFSWKELYRTFANSFSIPFSVFLSDYQKHRDYLEFTFYTNRARFIALSEDYISDWYFSNFFNSEKAFGDLNYEKEFCVQNDRNRIEYLKKLEDECYSSEDRTFKASEKLVKMASYYSKYEPTFLWFRMNEDRNNSFRNYVDMLREKEFNEIAQKASLVKNQDIMNRYQPLLEEGIHNSFGFDDKIDISKEKKLYFSFVMDRDPQAINMDQVVLNRFLFSLFLEFRKNPCFSEKIKTIRVGESFLQEIKLLLKRKIRYVSGDAQFCAHAISDKSVQEEYRRKVSKAEPIKHAEGLFTKPTIIIGEGFKFNCCIQFLAKDLVPEQLGRIADQNRRSDGQYVYQGRFLSRDELVAFIEKTKVLIQIVISYKIKAQNNAIVALDTFSHTKEE